MKHKPHSKNLANELLGFLLDLKKNKDEIVLLSPDEVCHPSVISAGITHQNIIGVAAGLALEGKYPIILTNTAFTPSMNYAQIKHSICQNNLPITILAYGEPKDLAILRNLPLTLISPASIKETEQFIVSTITSKTPSYILIPEEIKPISNETRPGKAAIIRTGEDVTIITTGPLAHTVLLTADKLSRQEIRCEVIYSPTVHPIDKHLIVSSMHKTRCMVVAERTEGLGLFVAEVLCEHSPAPLERAFGTPDDNEIIRAVRHALLRKSENICTTVPEIHGHAPLQSDLHFNLHNGGVIRSVPGLHQAMLEMNQEIFNHHVNENKNDFATWVKEAVKDELLASKLFALKTKTGMTATLATWLQR